MWCLTESAGWWMPLGWIFMVVFWGAIVVAGVWLISRLVRSSSSGTSTTGGNGALTAARERYATGEITREEFDEIKRNLS
jgi:putative membrane protein